jgi:hypothetical protein
MNDDIPFRPHLVLQISQSPHYLQTPALADTRSTASRRAHAFTLGNSVGLPLATQI